MFAPVYNTGNGVSKVGGLGTPHGNWQCDREAGRVSNSPYNLLPNFFRVICRQVLMGPNGMIEFGVTGAAVLKVAGTRNIRRHIRRLVLFEQIKKRPGE